MFGLPSGSSMWSALPWSAVTMQAPPRSVNRVDDTAEAFVDRLDGLHCRGNHAGVPDHVGVCEVDEPEAIAAALPALDELPATARALISGLWS